MTMEEYFNKHGHVIMGTDHDLKIGDTIPGLYVNIPDQTTTVQHPFRVSRVSNRKEYIAVMVAVGSYGPFEGYKNYYEVISD